MRQFWMAACAVVSPAAAMAQEVAQTPSEAWLYDAEQAVADSKIIGDALDRLTDKQLRGDLAALQAEVEQAKKAWLTALAAARNAKDAVAATQARIDRYEKLNAKFPTGQTPPEALALLADTKALLAMQQAEAAKAEKELGPKWLQYRTSDKAFRAYVLALAKPAELPRAAQTPAPRTTDGGATPCSIDSPPDRRAYRPNDCTRRAHALNAYRAAGFSSAGEVLPGRPLDRRGVTTQLTTSGDSSSVSLKLANSFNVRRYTKPGEPFRQRVWNWGYNIGAQADVKDSKGAIFGYREDDEDAARPLDRIDQRFKITAGINVNFFASESETSFDSRGATAYPALLAACRKDQASDAPALPSTCEGEQLIAWVFAVGKDGSYAHPDAVTQLNALHWGAAEKLPRTGFGLSGELSRPRFDYFPLAYVAAPDPWKPGKTKDVVDVSALPASFYADEPLRKRHWAYSLQAYGFWRLPYWSDRYGTALVVSATYKRDYKAAKQISVCPPTNPAVITTNELCRSVQGKDATKNEGWVPAIEVRQHFPGFGAIMPELGVAPKFSYDTDAKRYGIDLPLWFALDDKKSLSAGLSLAHQWGGLDDSGELRDNDTALSIFVGKTFNLGGF